MAPISAFSDHSTDMSSTAVMRMNWNALPIDMDSKAVNGNHLPLNKRNSTPIGYDLTSSHYTNGNPNKPISMPPCHQQATVTQELHRRLDRSHSDPVKGQHSSPGTNSVVGEGRNNGGTSSSRYKTELCRPFGETGFCKYGEKCQFAHGAGELRSMPRHPKYKTEPCRTFHTTGLCGYGARCHFIHNTEERRSPGPNNSPGNSSSSSVSSSSSSSHSLSIPSPRSPSAGVSSSSFPVPPVGGGLSANYPLNDVFPESLTSICNMTPFTPEILAQFLHESPPLSPHQFSFQNCIGEESMFSRSVDSTCSDSSPSTVSDESEISSYGKLSPSYEKMSPTFDPLCNARLIRLPIFETFADH